MENVPSFNQLIQDSIIPQDREAAYSVRKQRCGKGRQDCPLRTQ